MPTTAAAAAGASCWLGLAAAGRRNGLSFAPGAKQGPESIRAWMLGKGCGCKGARLIPIAACGMPAFGQYRVQEDGSFKPWALIILELGDGHIASINSFLDTETLFPRFGLPPALSA